jgi:hypothetical protein
LSWVASKATSDLQMLENSSQMDRLRMTSTHDCYKNETVMAVVERLSDITGINETNSEYLQLLRYEEDQHYQVHHDYIEHDVSRYKHGFCPERNV